MATNGICHLRFRQLFHNHFKIAFQKQCPHFTVSFKYTKTIGDRLLAWQTGVRGWCLDKSWGLLRCINYPPHHPSSAPMCYPTLADMWSILYSTFFKHPALDRLVLISTELSFSTCQGGCPPELAAIKGHLWEINLTQAADAKKWTLITANICASS